MLTDPAPTNRSAVEHNNTRRDAQNSKCLRRLMFYPNSLHFAPHLVGVTNSLSQVCCLREQHSGGLCNSASPAGSRVFGLIRISTSVSFLPFPSTAIKCICPIIVHFSVTSESADSVHLSDRIPLDGPHKFLIPSDKSPRNPTGCPIRHIIWDTIATSHPPIRILPLNHDFNSW
jgi:hypothetical protein